MALHLDRHLTFMLFWAYQCAEIFKETSSGLGNPGIAAGSGVGSVVKLSRRAVRAYYPWL